MPSVVLKTEHNFRAKETREQSIMSSFPANSSESIKQAQLYVYRCPVARQFGSAFIGSATIFPVVSRYIYMGRRGVYVTYSVWRARPHTNDCLFNGVHSFSIHAPRSTLPASPPVSFPLLRFVCYVRWCWWQEIE